MNQLERNLLEFRRLSKILSDKERPAVTTFMRALTKNKAAPELQLQDGKGQKMANKVFTDYKPKREESQTC